LRSTLETMMYISMSKTPFTFDNNNIYH